MKPTLALETAKKMYEHYALPHLHHLTERFPFDPPSWNRS